MDIIENPGEPCFIISEININSHQETFSPDKPLKDNKFEDFEDFEDVVSSNYTNILSKSKSL